MKGDIADNVVYQDAGTGGDDGLQMFNPCLVFADGDAFSSVCSSANLIFNGTSISLNRQNRFWRDWMRTQVACEDASRIYKAAGGSYDKYDQRPVVVGIGARQRSEADRRSQHNCCGNHPGFGNLRTIQKPVRHECNWTGYQRHRTNHSDFVSNSAAAIQPVARTQSAGVLPVQELPARHPASQLRVP